MLFPEKSKCYEKLAFEFGVPRGKTSCPKGSVPVNGTPGKCKKFGQGINFKACDPINVGEGLRNFNNKSRYLKLPWQIILFRKEFTVFNFFDPKVTFAMPVAGRIRLIASVSRTGLWSKPMTGFSGHP